MEVREKSSRKIILIFFVVFFIWVLLQFISPLTLSEGSVNDLSGYVGVTDNEYLTDKMPFPVNLVYNCGDKLCHQKLDRSFFLNNNQMPFCSRCTAIWLGLAIGLGFMVIYKLNLDERFIYVILIGLIPIGIDGVGQLFGLWESTAIVRVITGLLVGFVCGVAIGIIIDELKELVDKKRINSKKG
jgi:uncharacterized membrane protein